jgi:phosphoribosylformylglycinamidine cyclo-ligase
MVNGMSFIDQAMLPHTCYYKALKPLLPNFLINGMAHITGGGILDNLLRVIPAGLSANIDLSQVRVLPLFSYLFNRFKLDPADMLRTFNLGVGLVIVSKPDHRETIVKAFSDHNLSAYTIGRIGVGSPRVNLTGQLNL